MHTKYVSQNIYLKDFMIWRMPSIKANKLCIIYKCVIAIINYVKHICLHK